MRLIGVKKKLDKGCERGPRAQEPGRYIGRSVGTSLVNHDPRPGFTTGSRWPGNVSGEVYPVRESDSMVCFKIGFLDVSVCSHACIRM